MTQTSTDSLATVAPRAARWLAAACALAVTASPRIASACSVCMAGRDEANRAAFVATTAFMTFLPLLMIGGVLWWLARRVRRQGSRAAFEPAAQRPVCAPSPVRAVQA